METKLHRFEEAVRYLKGKGVVARQKDIAEKMCISEPSVSNALAGRDGSLSDKFLSRFNHAFGDIFSSDWLINGRGEMLSGGTSFPNDDTGYVTRLLPMSAMAGQLTGFDTDGVRDEDCERIVVPIAGVDFAITVYGDSMLPEFPSGTRVLVKRIDPSAYIAWGQVYVLDTTNGALLKEVQPCEDDRDFIVCHSLNPSGRYKDFEVARTHIRAMYRVLATITMK